MTELITCLSKGKGSLEYILKLIKEESWDKVYIITSEDYKNKFTLQDNTELIVVDFNKPSPNLINDIREKLRGKIKGFEIAVNIVSGTGKEHMAIISAIIKLGLALRFVVLAKSGVKEI